VSPPGADTEFSSGRQRKPFAAGGQSLKQRFPELRIVGRYSPEPQPIEKMDHEEILRRIEEARPDILLVAFGNPKQEEWIAMHRDRLKVPVCIGVGGTLDSLSGTTRRAPRWMQRCGLEWLHRTLQEPQRLAARYLRRCNLPDAPSARIPCGYRGPAKHAAEPSIVVQQVGNTKLISMIGDLTGRRRLRSSTPAAATLASRA
jgi:N-acetylglucosaminyldiphosphoundecaprenol N-acetyl-beta-D-mannosaminyltransferase